MQPHSMPTAMAAMATRRPPPSFSALFSIGPMQEALFSNLTRVELLKLVRTLCTECRGLVRQRAAVLRRGRADFSPS